MAALCPLVPLEIGNRVWLDSNGNGIQDADEIGVDGVTVELYRNGVLVGSTTTANGGQYYFNNSNVNQNGALGVVAGTGTLRVATPSMRCAFRMPRRGSTGLLAGLGLTGAHQTYNPATGTCAIRTASQWR